MKKFIKIAAISTLVLTLAACGSGGTQSPVKETESSTQPAAVNDQQPEKGAKLTMWANPGSQSDWARYVAQEYEKQYGIPVKVEEVKHTDAPGKMQTDGPAGVGADVFMAPHNSTGDLVTAGLVNENEFADEYRKNFLEAAI
jgi:arabinogalactan oligomer/maltooligosaccharide transport system substrate-binding protein